MSRIKIFLIVLFIIVLCKAGYTDIYIEEKIYSTIPGKLFHGVKKTYITNNRILLVDPTLPVKTIFDYANNLVYTIDDAKKDLTVYKLNTFKLTVNANLSPDFSALNERDLFSKESGNKKKIGKYNCFELVIYIPKMAAITRLWLTKDNEIPLAPYFTLLEKNNNGLLKKIMPLMTANNSCIVESATTIIRPKETEKNFKQELVKISADNIPDELFNLPADYRKLTIE